MSFEPFAEGDYDDETRVAGLEEGDKCAIHVFTASWCGHCKNFKKSAPELFDTRDMEGVVVVHHHDEDRKEWEGKWSCRGYPTVIFVKKDGERQEYDGERTTAAIVEAFRDFCD